MFNVCFFFSICLDVSCMFNPQNKLQNLAGQRSDVLENLSPIVRARVDALKDIQVCDILLLTQSDLDYVCKTSFFLLCECIRMSSFILKLINQ